MELKDVCAYSTTWWEEQASEEQLLETLTVAFPQIPTAWLQSCAATAFEAKEYALRCVVFCVLLFVTGDYHVHTSDVYILL